MKPLNLRKVRVRKWSVNSTRQWWAGSRCSVPRPPFMFIQGESRSACLTAPRLIPHPTLDSPCMDIHPIAITQCDWRQYNKAAEQAKGIRATHVTDKKDLDHKNLSTFFYTLHKDCILTEHSLRHGMASFMIVEIYHTTIIEMLQGWDCEFQMGKMEDDGFYWMLISAKLNDWFNFILMGCNEDVNKSMRIVANKLYELFTQSGFKDLFNHQMYNLPDGTFQLCQRKQ